MNLTSRKKQIPEYSFDDWAKSLFVLNLWLPHIASGAKFQFLYTLLESSSTQRPSSNKIKTYEEFEQFAESLLELVPDFVMFEDYVPEPDWGEIKYFFRDRFFKIFYGGELESAVDHYYAFEILHSGFDDYYRENLGSSALDDLEMCLSVQHAILDSIEHPPSDTEQIAPGDIEIPPQEFWSRCLDFWIRIRRSAISNRRRYASSRKILTLMRPPKCLSQPISKIDFTLERTASISS